MVAWALVLGLLPHVGAAEHGDGSDKPCRLAPSEADVARLAQLRPDRPRVLADQSDIDRAARLSTRDARAQGWRDRLRAEADALVGAEPTTYERIGPRLQFQAYKNRITTLGLAWRLEANPLYAAQATRELLAAADYPDWNPGHYLDTAEMTAITATGYDWFYDVLSDDARLSVRRAIVAKGLRTATCFYRHKSGPVMRTDNWGVVTNAGLAMGAVAVADTNPRLSAAILGNALRRVRPPMQRFAEDGSYPEGPGYWRYATEHAVKLLATLEAGFGRQFGVAAGGFRNTGNHPLHAVGPNRRVANFGDSREALGLAPQLYWLARRFDRPVDAWLARRQAAQVWSPLHLLWYSPNTVTPGTADVPASVVSHVGTAYLRGRWRRKRTGYVAVKGGSNAVSHAHPELGSFIYDVKAKRWATDLGRDDYNLPGYFDPNRRNRYYRLSTRGQNTLRISGDEQPRTAAATIRHFSAVPGRSEVVLGLNNAYPAAQRVRRGVALINRRQLLVQDEVTAEDPVSVVWVMHTRADVTLGEDGTTATLVQGDRQVTARLIDTRGQLFRFSAASAEQAEPQAPNRGVTRLQILAATREAAEQEPARLRLVVLLSPGNGGQDPPPVVPLRDWPLDDQMPPAE